MLDSEEAPGRRHVCSHRALELPRHPCYEFFPKLKHTNAEGTSPPFGVRLPHGMLSALGLTGNKSVKNTVPVILRGLCHRPTFQPLLCPNITLHATIAANLLYRQRRCEHDSGRFSPSHKLRGLDAWVTT